MLNFFKIIGIVAIVLVIVVLFLVIVFVGVYLLLQYLPCAVVAYTVTGLFFISVVLMVLLIVRAGQIN